MSETIEEIEKDLLDLLNPKLGPEYFRRDMIKEIIGRIQSASRAQIEAEIMANLDERLKKLITTTFDLYYSQVHEIFCFGVRDKNNFGEGKTFIEAIEKAEKELLK